MHRITPTTNKKYIKKAVKDEHLKKVLLNATLSTVSSRQAIIDLMPYWEQLRRKTHDIKRDVIEHLDKYLEQFEKNCIANGLMVHWAKDAKEANDIILKLAADNDVRTVVKSKSLTTEEIGLNYTLAENDIRVFETDLGEFIVQLAGQIPSHLIIPALHLSREDIGKVFAEKLECEYTDDPVELLHIARATLRRQFLTADMGISGANFAVADTGCICIVENEANAHLTTSLPRVHVAVVGIEKIIPSIKDLSYFLKLLPPNATGQKISTYVNFIGATARRVTGEGPEQVHIILLDNGRSEVLKDAELRQTLFCIRCGACLNVCPVYQHIGGHAYGWVYMGPIGINLIPQYLGLEVGKKSPYLCSLCRACEEVCSTKIDLPGHILHLRNSIIRAGKGNFIERIGMKLWAFAANHPRLYRFGSWFPAKLQRLLPGGMRFPAPGYFRERILPRFDYKGFRNKYKKYVRQSGNDANKQRDNS